MLEWCEELRDFDDNLKLGGGESCRLELFKDRNDKNNYCEL